MWQEKPLAHIMNIGQIDTLEAIIYPLETNIYNQVFWQSSNTSVATVSGNGVVTAVYSGVCTITAIAGDKKAACEIKVRAIDLEFDFSKAVAYFYGNVYDENINTAILRFYSAGYNIEPDGSVSGAGYYFSTEINYPKPNLLPPQGIFENSDSHQNFTFFPGQIENSVSGSYFVFYSLDGMSTIAVEKGKLNIEANSIYGNFTGAQGENIDIKYNNDIHFVDFTLPPPDTLKVDNPVATTFINESDRFSNGTNTIKYRIYLAADTYLQIEFVVPLSADFVPSGFYRLNDTHLPYSLAESDLPNSNGTLLVENASLKSILYGNVKVETLNNELTFKIYLVDENGRVIVN
jgi:hypothetical protein